MENEKSKNIWLTVARVASHLGYRADVVSQWKSRGYVPPSHHYDLAQGALALGENLTHKTLHSMWKSARLGTKWVDPPQY